MISSAPLYCTVDKCRLHIADWNSNYGGSVDSYNNFLTRFFSKLFRISMDLDINGKIYVVNKEDYKKFLESHQIMPVQESLEAYKNFGQIFSKHQLNWGSRQKMSRHISQHKATQLFRKLAQALVRKNFDKAQKLAGQGADLNKSFWDRGVWGISFENKDSNLPQQSLNFQAEQYSPILFVAKFHPNFVNFFQDLGADNMFIGEIWHYNRVFSHTEIQQTIDTVPVLRNERGLLMPTGRVVTTPRTITKDIYQNQEALLGRHYINHITHQYEFSNE